MVTLKRSVIMVLALTLALTGALAVSAQATTTAWLGVSITDTADGVMIAQVVAGSPADEAGLRHGDIITAAAATEIDSAATLVATIQALAPGDEIAVTFKRAGEADTVMVTLAERSADTDTAITPFRRDFAARPGVMIMSLFGTNLEMTDEGLLVQSIRSESPLAAAGLQEGDLITAINGESLTSSALDDATMPFMFDFMHAAEPLVLAVVRAGEEIEIEVELDFKDLSLMPGMMSPDSDLQIQVMPVAGPTQLGVQYLTINAEVVAEYELTVDQGALIVAVYDDTPAAEAGLLADDIILAVDGDTVDEERTLPDRLYAYEAGDVVTLSVLRAGEKIEIEVELGPNRQGMWGWRADRMGENRRDFFEDRPFNGRRPFRGQNNDAGSGDGASM
ncbi:MAG: PDZ domain-containing protein [Anaerolineae bacterium]|nr:PDZ domain-containing protein [Anaerolineae bacterium]